MAKENLKEGSNIKQINPDKGNNKEMPERLSKKQNIFKQFMDRIQNQLANIKDINFYYEIIFVSIIFLFMLQSITILIQNIYIMDLLNTQLDEKVLGLLFFFTPIVFLFLKKIPPKMIEISSFVIIISRILIPFFNTSVDILISGLCVGSSLLFLILYIISFKLRENVDYAQIIVVGLIFSIILSILFRTLNSSVDISLYKGYQIIGWVLGGIALYLLFYKLNLGKSFANIQRVTDATKNDLRENLNENNKIISSTKKTNSSIKKENLESSKKSKKNKTKIKPNSKGLFLSIIGMMIILFQIYFYFESPTVIDRWISVPYQYIIFLISFLLSIVAIIFLYKPQFIIGLNKTILFLFNALFAFVIFWTVNSANFRFPDVPTDTEFYDFDEFIFPSYAYIPLTLFIIYSFIMFVDLALFVYKISNVISNFLQFQDSVTTFSKVGKNLKQTESIEGTESTGGNKDKLTNLNEFKIVNIVKKCSIAQIGGSLIFILLVFAFIFTNVWGYVEPVSTFFRNKYCILFMWINLLLLICVMFSLKKALKNLKTIIEKMRFIKTTKGKRFAILVSLIFIISNTFAAIITSAKPVPPSGTINSIKIMTYNIQQGVDEFGNFNFDGQLELIKQINPDIIGLEESDTARLNLGNNDVVRYFADHLNYYSFYGPRPQAGTFGTAVLSKFPIKNYMVIFSYSDKDEIGTSYVEIEINNQLYHFFINHPDGSDIAKLSHVYALLNYSISRSNVILMGDFNWKTNSIYYNMITDYYIDVWRAKWPNGTDDQGIQMIEPIDHIFVSPTFNIIDARYISTPYSQSDHPILWAELYLI
ncbi:MAG: endonuclease/exonuclease/phosphatase family protein [Promethearchaeota archaeon]